jgi:PAS domain S-box-containing protein
MESSLDGILITDPRLEDNPIIYCNPAFLRITGYEKHEIMFRNCGFLYRNDADQDGIYRIRQALRKKIGCHVIIRNYTKDGLLFWNELSLAPVCNSEGELINYVGIIKDITDRVNMDEEIIKRQRLDALSLLAGGIAHDLGNRLSTILLNVSLAQSVIESHEPAHKLLANTEKACESVGALTQQLVAFSKGGDPVRTDILAPDIISSAMQFTPFSPGIEYRLDLPENLWTVNVDEGQMIRVISNIFWNAIQAMPGGGTIHISAENLTSPPQSLTAGGRSGGEYVRVSIRDEGVGIPVHLLNKIFEPYFTTKKGGHGLGLAAAHSIIQNHGGYLKADSEPGKGTTFMIWMPTSPKIKKPVKRYTEKVCVRISGRILILEDEVSLAILLKEMLEHLGCTVSIADDGQQAIDLYDDAIDNSTPFDVVILDMMIKGGMGGMHTVARLKEIDPKVKAIATSGLFEQSFASNYMDYGFKARLWKPYTMEGLLQVLNSLL